MRNKMQTECFVPLIKMSMIKEKELPYEGKEVNTPERTVKLAREILGGADREYLIVLSVDNACKPVAVEIVAVGTLCSVQVEPREVFKHAILSNAAGIILIHNHTSGKCEPSREDLETTERIRRAGLLLGIPLRDHIIVGDGYLSMWEEGLMKQSLAL